MKHAPISVIITTYNDAEYLSKAIDSVFNQSLLPRQLVVVDDGSKTNDAKEIVDSYKFNDKEINIIFFRKKNGGASSARNFGLKYVDQEFVTFLDADDKMLLNNLHDKYNFIRNLDTSYFGVYGSAKTTKKEKHIFSDSNGLVPTSLVGKSVTGIPGGSCYYLFRLSALNEIQGFDENLHNNEDYDLLVRLIKNCKKCKGSTGYGNLITIRKNSLSRGKDSKKIFDNVMTFLDKAEKNDFFDKEDLNSRRKSAHLILIRKTILKKPIRALSYIDFAFSYGSPEGWKQKSMFIISSAIKFRSKNYYKI